MAVSSGQKGKAVDKSGVAEKSVHPNWVALIRYCGVAHKNGNLTFSTQAAIPMMRIKTGTREKIEFGKTSTSAEPLFIKEINASLVRVRVTKKWSDLMDFCAQSFPYGQVCVEIAAGEPKRPIGKYTWSNISFGHPESLPPLVRFFNNEETKD